MRTINLKDYYPFYTQDTFVDVPDEILAIFEDSAKAEAAYERKKFRYKADAGKSGKSIEGRPAFKQMLYDIENGLEIHYILVYLRTNTGKLHKIIILLPKDNMRRL